MRQGRGCGQAGSGASCRLAAHGCRAAFTRNLAGGMAGLTAVMTNPAHDTGRDRVCRQTAPAAVGRSMQQLRAAWGSFASPWRPPAARPPPHSKMCLVQPAPTAGSRSRWCRSRRPSCCGAAVEWQEGRRHLQHGSAAPQQPSRPGGRQSYPPNALERPGGGPCGVFGHANRQRGPCRLGVPARAEVQPRARGPRAAVEQAGPAVPPAGGRARHQLSQPPRRDRQRRRSCRPSSHALPQHKVRPQVGAVGAVPGRQPRGHESRQLSADPRCSGVVAVGFNRDANPAQCKGPPLSAQGSSRPG